MKGNKVTYYTNVVLRFCFPNDEVMCSQCPCAQYDGRRITCGDTGEFITNDKTFGYRCRLKIMEVNDDTGEVTENPIIT